jgi:tripartite-type tricarboxylate transporter receptor subunit TctC
MKDWPLMKLPRGKFLLLPLSAAALVIASSVAWAQAYPTRPVRILVGFAAGGSSAIHARLLGQWLSERLLAWSQSFRPIIAKSS